MTIRLPPYVRAELDAASYVLGLPQWRVLVDAIRAYTGTGPSLSEEQLRQIRTAVRLGPKASG
jgi:hypothetical protein